MLAASTSNTASDALAFKYRAFISYSDLDRQRAHWLHSELERYRLPSEIARRLNSHSGVISRRKLGRFFIDRFDLAAGSLDDQIQLALRQSENLIVVCSPNSRKSRHVNEEILAFRALGHGRILALIVGGEPDDGDHDCFPEAMKFRSDGAPALPVLRLGESLAADVRPDKDGEYNAKLKLVAGVLGVDLDELRRRDVLAERRRRHRATAVAGAMTVLAGAAVWFANDSFDKRKFAYEQAGLAKQSAVRAEERRRQSFQIAFQFADKIQELANNLEIPIDKAKKLLEVAEVELVKLESLDADSEMAQHAVAKMKLANAVMQSRLGDSIMFSEYAKSARDSFRRLSNEHPSNLDYLKNYGHSSFQVGMSMRDQGYLDVAIGAFDEAIEARSALVLFQPHQGAGPNGDVANNRLDLSSVYLEKANVLARQGLIEDAVANFELALVLRQELVDQDAGDGAGSIEKRISVTEVQVDYADALGFAGNRERQIELLQKAVYERRLLVKANAGNPKLKRFLAWGNVFLGEALLDAGDAQRALPLFEEARVIQAKLHEADPTNAKRKKDLAWAAGHLSDALFALAHIDDAIAGYGEAVRIAETALAKDQTSLARSRDVAYWLARRGKVLRAGNRLVEAREDLERSIRLLRQVVQTDSTNRRLRSEFAEAQLELGRVKLLSDEKTVAAEHLRNGQMQLNSIALESPSVKRWRQQADDAERETEILLRGGG